MNRVELAVPILSHIPYNLIVIDSELLEPANKEFTRALQETRQWRTVSPVVLTDSHSRLFDTELFELGAIAGRKSAWKDDLLRFSLAFEEVDDVRTTLKIPLALGLQC
jgi:hypothetical protein